jgi:hypothetical protein
LNNATYTGFVNGDTPASLAGMLNCTTTASQSSPVGTYPITCSGQSSTVYAITYVSGTLTVSPAPLSLTASNATRVYGALNPPLNNVTASGFVNGDSLGSLAGTLSCTTTATQGSPVAAYPITCSGLTSENYSITFVPGVLTIGPAPLNITGSNASRPYGAANPPLNNVTAAGFVNGDSLTSLSGTLVCTTTAVATSPAGAYAITCSGLVSPNYSITYLPGTLTITSDVLTITANNATRQYGQANPPLNNVTYSGFVNGDTASVLAGALSCTSPATPSSPVSGSPSTITCSGLTSTNYTISYVPGQLAITPASLTIIANNASRLASQPNPTFMVSYSGFANGDTATALSGTLSCTTTATPASPAGDYPITCAGLSSTNYTINFVPGQLTVTAPVCVPDVTAAVSITRSGFSYSPISRRYAQTLTLMNAGGNAVAGPIYIVLDNLSSNATLYNAGGSTTCAAPVGSPYVSLTGPLNPGATATVVLQFTNPTNAPINYVSRVLASAGQP